MRIKKYFAGKKVILAGILALLAVGGLIFYVVETGEKEPEIKQFTAFFDSAGESRNSDNIIKQKIAEITGAMCEEMWLSGQSRETILNYYIANEEYPDFISGGQELYEAQALIPIDLYWEKYPNIYNYMEPEEWDKIRLEDGHIYWIPQFGIVNGEMNEVIHEGEAFWIQTRVLEWAGYPNVRTLDQYFDLIEAYMAANPEMENGTPNIPFTILCDDWRYFCLENVPQFLDGYPNDGSCIVEPDTLKVRDYNITPTAKKYFKKLNEQYLKGMIDPQSFTNTYEEYLEKLSTGAVLGMVDQWWEFAYDIQTAYERQQLSDLGCNYVPLPITISEDVKNQWYVKRSNQLDVSKGISVTVSCKDMEGALQFINDLLEPEVMNLRFWGVEGEDYLKDENGVFYRTSEQRKRPNNEELMASYFCTYSYFPRKEGLCADGINAFSPEYQQGEFYDALPEKLKECMQAYGCKNYVEMLGSNEHPGKWFPMYSHTTMMTHATEAGRVWEKMTETKKWWLPQVVMTENFEETWEQYLEAYQNCNPEILFEELQREVYKRVGKQP